MFLTLTNKCTFLIFLQNSYCVFISFYSDCPGQFSKAEALYCDKDCGADWIDNQYGCQINDADAYCRLKHCNSNATAKKFDVLPAKAQPGFACQGIGMRFERWKNGTKHGYHGIFDFHYVDDIKNTHGEGKVVTNVICVNRSSKLNVQIVFLKHILLLILRIE